MAFEKTVPQWSATGTEPPSSLKTSGFSAGYKPPAAYFNWFWNGVSECLTELQEVVGSIGGDGPFLCNAISSDGVSYTATVSGITELYTGLAIILIPSRVSSSTTCTLNVNSLGSKYLKQATSYTSSATLFPSNTSWLGANKPILLIYNGEHFVSTIARANASDLYGTVAITKGGTGATTAETARENLGAVTKKTFTVTVPASGWGTSKSQIVHLEGMKYQYDAHVVVLYTGTITTDKVIKEAWNLIHRIDTSNNCIYVYCFEDTPTIDLDLYIEVIC